MNLAIDIGNTRTKLGLFKDTQLVDLEVWPTWSLEQLSRWATNQKVKNVILSTVRPHVEAEVLHYLNTHFRFIQVDAETPLPIENRYKTPKTLGKDRLAALVGAFQLYPYSNCLVIDAGTCITYDILNAEGAFLGGNISPGMPMRLQAMHTFTAGLPMMKPVAVLEGLGDDTESALQNGAQMGAVLEMKGFIELFSSRFRRINVILTGGDADFFAKNLKSEIFVINHLVLLGLNKILLYNVERLE